MNNWIKKQIYHFTETNPDYAQAIKILEDAKVQGVTQVSGKIQPSHFRKAQELEHPRNTIDDVLEVMRYFQPGIVQNGGQYKPYIKKFEATYTVIGAKKSAEHTLEVKTRCWGGNAGSTGKVNDWLRINYVTPYAVQDK